MKNSAWHLVIFLVLFCSLTAAIIIKPSGEPLECYATQSGCI